MKNLVSHSEVYTHFYFFIQLFCFLIKGLYLIYPPDTIGVEIFCLFLFYFFTLTRSHIGKDCLWFIGKLGNKSESSFYLVFFMIFTIVAFFSFCYYMFLQTYVMKFEVIINAVGGVMVSLEFVFCLLAIIIIGKNEKTM